MPLTTSSRFRRATLHAAALVISFDCIALTALRGGTPSPVAVAIPVVQFTYPFGVICSIKWPAGSLAARTGEEKHATTRHTGAQAFLFRNVVMPLSLIVKILIKRA